jgi:hypothetical protein
VVARQKDQGRLDEFMFGFARDKLLFTSHVWRGQLAVPLPADLPTWFHVAVTRHRDGTTVLFVGGKEMARRHTSNGILDGDANPIVIGGAFNSPDHSRVQAHYDGAIDELVIYDRALGEAEIAALASGKPGL